MVGADFAHPHSLLDMYMFPVKKPWSGPLTPAVLPALLTAACTVPYETTQRRDELFAISGVRGNYPQCFLVSSKKTTVDGSAKSTTTYWGGYEKVRDLNDASSYPPPKLKDHPVIETWDQVFR